MRKSFVGGMNDNVDYTEISNYSKCLDARIAKKTKKIKTLSMFRIINSYLEQVLKMSFAQRNSEADKTIKVFLNED